MRQIINSCFLRASEDFSIFRFNGRAPVFVLFFRCLTTDFGIYIRAKRPFPRIIRKAFRRIIQRGRVLFRVFLFSTMSNFAHRGRRLTSGIFSARISTQIKFKMAFLLHRFSDATREGINTGLVRSVVWYAQGCYFSFRSFIAAVGRIISDISGQGSNACIHFGRVFRAALTNSHLRFAVIFMYQEDNGLINDCGKGVILRGVFMR